MTQRKESNQATEAIAVNELSEFIPLVEKAVLSPRKRAHLLLHRDHSDAVQRLFISLAAGTYVRPHCHPRQWEMIILLEGKLDILRLDAEGQVLQRHPMDRTSSVVEISEGIWHSVVVKSVSCLVLEIKPGPYDPSVFASWSPEEGTRAAQELLETWGR